MPTRVAVVRFPGSNCDRDTVWALEQVGAEPVLIDYNQDDVAGCTRVVLPGGFSYGDYLRAGALAAHAPIMNYLSAAIDADNLAVLGICNGFQILCERGLLPGALWSNLSSEFRCSWEWVEVVNSVAGWPGFRPGQRFRLPIAHAQGAYRGGDRSPGMPSGLGGAAFLRYVDPESGALEYNPNGSESAIAGIVQGRVMGLMPHPERAMDAVLGSDDGRKFLSLWLEG